MSALGTTRMIAAYKERITAPMFLAGHFKTPPENFHRSEKVEIDIKRSDPHVAIPLPNVNTGARQHQSSKYVNKGFTPPVYDIETTISAYSKLKRQPGQDPFQDPDFLGAATTEAFDSLRELEDLIRRGVELQASQVFADGVITLKDADGNTVYTLDYKPKATHLITVGTTWALDGTTGEPLNDIEAAAEVVRQDGKIEPDRLVLGKSALQRFLANQKVQDRLDNRRMELGLMRPQDVGTGATFFGWVWVGLYRFELWGYKDTYIDPQTGNHKHYVDPDHVLVLSSGARLDLTFGELPMFIQPEGRAAQFLPPRMAMPDVGMDLTTFAWITPDGKHLKLSAGTRALCIPTAIDTFARIDVTA